MSWEVFTLLCGRFNQDSGSINQLVYLYGSSKAGFTVKKDNTELTLELTPNLTLNYVNKPQSHFARLWLGVACAAR